MEKIVIKLGAIVMGSAMPPSKSHLWLSVTLLVLAYSAFGYWLSVHMQMSSVQWVVAVIIILAINLLATYPDRIFQALFRAIFGADLRSLVLVMGLSTMLIFILTGLTIFTQLLLLLAAALLFSMEIHEQGIARLQIMLRLAICQIVGLGLGFGSKMAWLQAIHYWSHLYRMLGSHGV